MKIEAKDRLTAASDSQLQADLKVLHSHVSSIDKATAMQDKIIALEEVINQAKAAIRTCERLDRD